MKLLAKSRMDGKEVTLYQHVITVCDTATLLFGKPDEPTRLAKEWLRFFRLPSEYFPKFLTNVLVAAALHDIGKANDGFQKAVQGKSRSQVIRHEHLSGLLLYLSDIRQWLSTSRALDFNIVVSAVVSHHLKVTYDTFAVPISDASTFIVHAGSEDFNKILQHVGNIIGASPPILKMSEEIWSFDGSHGFSLSTLKREFLDDGHQFKRALKNNDTRKRLLLAVKAGLLASDSAGSGIVRVDQSLESWIKTAFSKPLIEQDIKEKIISPRIEQIQSQRKCVFEFQDFQKAAGELGPRALLLSGCGTGKTLAAWKWVQARLRKKPTSRVLFLYPTRATTTEGFRDYVSWAGDVDATLLHGTAAYDLEAMFANPGDPREGGDYTVNERLFALGYWHKRIFSATVDSFLPFMQNKYAPLCLLPVVADSVIVVDEVHSFDNSMFRALVDFLKFFDVPVLCMTASLPTDRQTVLAEVCGLEIFPKDPSAFMDLKRQSDHLRYRLREIESAQTREVILDSLQQKKKVLWVVNTVSRCQEAARSLEGYMPDKAIRLCYHSRFRLMDRRDRHEQVIQAFKEHRGTAVMITTQVCEMSLDLDADILITEFAPVPALIQRMGRCCREPVPTDARIGEVFGYQPVDEKPYSKEEVKQGYLFFNEMCDKRDISQTDLSNYLAQMEVADPFIKDGYSSFLDSGWGACSADQDFREGEEFTVDCVLDADVDEFLKQRKSGKNVDGFIVPVKRRFAKINPRLPHYLLEAPSKHYHSDYGFMDEEMEL